MLECSGAEDFRKIITNKPITTDERKVMAKQNKKKKKAAPNANQNYADFTKAYCIDIAIAAQE